MSVSRLSDTDAQSRPLQAASAAEYIGFRFDSKCNRIGEPSSCSPAEWQAGAWRPPQNSHVFPASRRVGISLTPSGSRGSAIRRDGRGHRWGRYSWSHVRDPMLAHSTTQQSRQPAVRGGGAR